MAALGKSGEGGEGGMDIASMMASMGGMGGMGGGPEASQQQVAQKNQADLAAKNAGEVEGGSDGKKYKYEQTSKYGDSEIIVRFALQTPAAKKDVKVVFKAATLSVAVHGEELLNGKLYGTVQTDDCTWCLVEKGSELQVMLALTADTKWQDLMAPEESE